MGGLDNVINLWKTVNTVSMLQLRRISTCSIPAERDPTWLAHSQLGIVKPSMAQSACFNRMQAQRPMQLGKTVDENILPYKLAWT